MRQGPGDVDALRDKLKALGYLDAGVDRFVLAPARAGRGLVQIALRASVRIGVLAGLLLGVSGGLAAATRLPGLVTGVRDSVVLASMLGLAFGAAAFLSTFLVIWATARLLRALGPRPSVARGGTRLATLAGGLVGAASLAYLTLWWGATAGHAGAAMPAASTVAVLVAAVISVLLGHSTTTIIRAVLAAEHPDTAPPRRPVSLRASAAIALVGAAASAGLLALGAPAGEHATAPPPALAVRPTGLRVLVIAIDGGDRALFDSLRRRHPELFERSPWLVPFCALAAETDDPAREWVTIATGQPVDRHGVTALEVRRLAGLEGRLPAARDSRLTATLAAGADLLRLTRPAVSTGAIRQEKTFWEVAAQAGLRTAALNWWTSWPALPRDGIVLSERAVLRLERGGHLAAEIAPESRYESLRTQWPALSARAERMAAEVLDEDGDSGATPGGEIAAALREAALVDAQQLVLLGSLTGDRLDLATVYLPGLDILAARLRDLSRDGATSAMLVGAGDALVRYSRWLAANLADLVEPLRPDVEPLVVAHPGRVGGPAQPPAPRDEAGAARSSPPCSLLDIAPGVLAALGVPLSAELPGTVSPALIERLGRNPRASAAALAVPPAAVATYGRRGAGAEGGARPDALDEEMRERLRSLGYVR